MPDNLSTSNSLPDLAARIRAEHEATADALKTSIGHGIAAGELLVEAKEQVPHGEWLPWLKTNCAISERTAQLYMRLAKNRIAIEEQIRNGVADLSLNEAAALLMLTSDVKKLFEFAREAEHLSGESLVEFCITHGVGVMHDHGYNQYLGRSEAEKLEWHLFIMFLSFDAAEGRHGGEPQGVASHIEWVMQRPFQNVGEWIGPAGEAYCRSYGMRTWSEQFKADWAAFFELHREWELPDVVKKLVTLQGEYERARAEGRFKRKGKKLVMKRAAA
jgi:hypothetical protein